jgi:hypothetical protein
METKMFLQRYNMELYIIVIYAGNVFLHRLKAIYLFSKIADDNIYQFKLKLFVVLLMKKSHVYTL